jgi:hypothetical protein
MGLFRRKDERAIPKPGSQEFEEAVQGTALPDSESVSMGEPGWTEPGTEPEERDQAEADQPKEPTEAEQPEQTAEAEQPAQAPEERDGPGRTEKVLGALGRTVLKPPNADGFGGGMSAPKRKPKK